MLTPTNFNCNSPPFLIKIKRRAKNVSDDILATFEKYKAGQLRPSGPMLGKFGILIHFPSKNAPRKILNLRPSETTFRPFWAQFLGLFALHLKSGTLNCDSWTRDKLGKSGTVPSKTGRLASMR